MAVSSSWTGSRAFTTQTGVRFSAPLHHGRCRWNGRRLVSKTRGTERSGVRILHLPPIFAGMAEWSKAPACRAGSKNNGGSNPSPCTNGHEAEGGEASGCNPGESRCEPCRALIHGPIAQLVEQRVETASSVVRFHLGPPWSVNPARAGSRLLPGWSSLAVVRLHRAPPPKP
jgi:hypothetical protein